MMACFTFRVPYAWAIGLIGNIELWYCSCSFRNVYEMRYVVSFDTPDGLKDAVGLRSYNTNDYTQMLNDAIALANTPLLERD